MQKQGVVVWLSLVAVACGAAPAQKPEARQTNVVAVPSAAPDEPAATDQAAPVDDRATSGRDFAGCVLDLRSASALPSRGEDRSDYAAALAAERAGNMSEARKLYFGLIQKQPSSPLIPLAYLAFGEMFAGEARSDPSKWDLARAAYQEVIKYPPPENVAWSYAMLRLGDSTTAGDPTSALARYKSAIEGAKTHPMLPCSEEIASQARAGLIDAFSRAGAPEKAWTFFRALSDEAQATEMILELVAIHEQRREWSAACAAAKNAPSEPRLEKAKTTVCAKH